MFYYLLSVEDINGQIFRFILGV